MKADVVAGKNGSEHAAEAPQLELKSQRQIKRKSKRTKAEMRRTRGIKARKFRRPHNKKERQSAKHLVALARSS